MNSKRQVADWAVETAAKNGERDYPNYDVEQWAGPLYMVSPKPYNGTMYAVEMDTCECQCEFFAREGVCKHLWMVNRFIADNEEADRAALLFGEEDPFGDSHQTAGLYE